METTLRTPGADVTHQANADNVQITRHYVGENGVYLPLGLLVIVGPVAMSFTFVLGIILGSSS